MFLAIGSTTVDLFISGLDRLPHVGGDEFTTSNLAFLDEPLAMVLGGNGGNSAFVAARLGWPTMLCTAIGQDSLGDLIMGWLTEVGVNTRGVVRYEKAATAYTTVITDKALNRLAFHHRGASAAFNTDDLPAGLLDQATICLLNGYPLMPAWRPDGALETLTQARKKGIITAFDFGPAIGKVAKLEELRPLLQYVDYLFCNAHELAVCIDSDDLETGSAQLLEAGVKCVVLKRGQMGVLLREADFAKTLNIPGFTVDARFTVGAGDSFNTAFLYGIAQSWDLVQAAQFANATAALVVSSAKGVLGSPTLAEVQALLDNS